MIYKTIASPFNIIWALSIAIILYLLRLSTQITLPSLETFFYLTLSIFCMVSGVSLGTRLKSNVRNINISSLITKKPTRPRNLTILYFFISTVVFLYEHLVFYNKFGTFPIFNTNFEVLRMEFPVSGYVHIVAMASFVFALYLYYDRLLYKNTWTRSQSIIFYILIVSNIVLSFLVGNRGGIAIFLVQCFIVKYSFKKISLSRLIMVALMCGYFLVVAKFARDYLYSGSSILDQIAEIWVFGKNIFLIPLYYCYVTFVMNFEILNKYILLMHDFYYGHFTIMLPFESLLNKNAYELINLQNEILKDDFYGVLTATGFGVPYFDFGYFGVVVIFLLSYLFGFIFYITYACGKVYYIPFYSFYMTTFLTLIYTYNFNKLYVWIYLVILFFISRMYRKSQHEI